MKFNPKNLKNLFSTLRKTPIDDIAVNAVKANADDIAAGILDVADDIPTSISFDDIADTYKNRIPANKTPITSSEFTTQFKNNRTTRRYNEELETLFPNMKSQIGMSDERPNLTDADLKNMFFEKPNNTPDYDALDVRPERFDGYNPNLVGSIDYPDGFTNPDGFARYYDSLETGIMPVHPFEYEHTVFPFVEPKSYGKESAYLATNLLNQAYNNMPMSDNTLRKAQDLIFKYPHYHRDGLYNYPKHMDTLLQTKQDGSLQNLYRRIYNSK